MKLYRSKVTVVAKEVIDRLIADEDVEILPERREEAEMDLAAIMEEFLRRDNALRDRVRDHMDARNLQYTDYGRTKKRIAEQVGHPLGEDVERFLARQFCENLMITPNVEEVFEEDSVIYKKMLEVLRINHVDEREIRETAAARIKNFKEGTVDYELALKREEKAEKKRLGLI